MGLDGWRLRLRLRFSGGSIELSRESPLYGLAVVLGRQTLAHPSYPAFAFANTRP